MLGPAVLPPSVPCLSRVRSALHFPAMHPHNKAPRLALLTAPNAPAAHTAVSCRRPETGLWATPFEYCGAVCRTTARSTQHENAFILDRRHCFSQVGAGCGALAAGMGCCAAAAPYTTCCAAVLHSTAICHCDGAWISINHALTSPTNPPTHPGTHPPTHPPPIHLQLGRPHVAVPPAPPLPAGITLVAGSGGQTCDAACAAKQMGCKEEHFASLNDCNSLRAKFMCEAGGLALCRRAGGHFGSCC